MKTKLGVLLVLSIAGLTAAVSVARPAATDGTLQATVGPGYSINLTQNGVKVTHLDPGTYTIDVNDQADIHNFDLFGPGVKQSTGVDTIGTATWTVTFTDGTYNYVCDAHPATMKGSFTVGTVQTTTTTTPPPVPLKVKAKAKVAARTVVVTATATKVAALDFALWKGTKRVAHATGKAKIKTVKLKAPSAGRYVAKITARAGGKIARASAIVSVK
ncbi:MAG: cupredoxin domain-containing protein [Gaiellaceae bacterium]